MKNYNFIPHAANTRSRSQVINLIEAEGAAGYGFYWALLEYLRAQNTTLATSDPSRTLPDK